MLYNRESFPANNKKIMQPRNFSTVNDLHYTVLGAYINVWLSYIKGLGNYRIAGKFGGGESLVNLANRLWFTKLKPSNLVLTIDNLLADLLIHQTFFHQMLKKSQFAKRSPHQTFLLYGIYLLACNKHWK